MSLWAAVAAPHDCSSSQAADWAHPGGSEQEHHSSHRNGDQSPAVMANPEMNHAMHHDSLHDMPQDALQGGRSDATEPCCDTCWSACLAGNLTLLNLQLAELVPAIPAMHYKLDRAEQFMPGPSYPSLYRPPISRT
ncbi:MAG TPA: hypothetical protein VFG52_11225 [Xanthomonadales bacterium]|nr:hypothetical protein [Xanthomonadales bacterium]